MADTVTVATQFSLTQTQLIWRDFKRHRAALVGGVVIGLLYFTALLAEPIAPYDPFHREIKSPLVPPMLFHVRDTEGRFHLPFVYALELKRDPETFSPLYVQRTDQRYPVALFVRGDEYRLWNLFTWDVHLFGVKGEPGEQVVDAQPQGVAEDAPEAERLGEPYHVIEPDPRTTPDSLIGEKLRNAIWAPYMGT